MTSYFRNFSKNFKSDFLSGLTVSLALVPEAVAFAFVAGVAPLTGLYAAFLIGLFTSLLGRPGMISGATGAMAVVMIPLVATHGIEYLFATVVLTGLLQILAGTLKLGRFISLVPHPVMLGFVNGLAIVIFLAQLGQFKIPDAAGVLTWMPLPELLTMGGLVLLTMLIIEILPRFTRALPSSLVAIVLVSLISGLTGIEARTVGDVASIAGGLPSFHMPVVGLNMDTLRIIFPYAVVLAGVGLIESLLTVNLIDEITRTRGKVNGECVAQGIANVVTGFFGGMGGCAMLGQSMINISSGGRGRLSGFTAAMALLVFIVFGAPLIEKIPVAALTGVMFIVVIKTFEWSSFRVIRKVPRSDAFVIILVSLVTVFTDLAVAVTLGVVVSALCFAWKHARQINVIRTKSSEETVYEISGPLFFGSASRFSGFFEPASDSEKVILDFSSSRVCDHSGMEAVGSLVRLYQQAGISVELRHLSGECLRLFNKAKDVVKVPVPD